MNPALAPKPSDKKSDTPKTTNPALIPAQPQGGGFAATGLIMPNVNVGDPLESYAEYGVPLSPFIDLNEERARRQSRTEKWANGTAKMFTTAAASFADGTVGTLVGLGSLLSGGSFYDNEFGRGVDQFNEWMQKELPNYYTQAELNTKGLGSVGDANFWSDKVLNGIGYMAGSIATVGTGVGAANLLSKGLKSYKIAKAVSTGTKASKMFSNTAKATVKGLNAGKTAAVGALSAVSEASVEAREVLRNAEERLTEEALKEYGVDNAAQLPGEKLREIKERSQSEGNTAFWLNTTIVGFSNIVTFGNLLLPRYLQMRPKLSGINKAAKSKKWVDATEGVSKASRIAKESGKQVGKGLVTESFQEGMQYAIQESSEAMGDSSGLLEMLEALGNGYLESFDSKEGIDSMLVGGIVGMLGGGAGSVRRALSMEGEDAQRKAIINALNNPGLFNAVEHAETSLRSEQISKEMNKALEEGDHKSFRDKQMDLLINEAIQFENAGRMDLLYERLDDELNRTDEEFKEVWGLPQDMNVDKTKIISGLKEDLRKFQSIKETIDARYPSTEEYNFAQKKFFGEDAAKDRVMQIKAEREYKNQLYATAFKLEDIDSRIEKLGIEIGELSGKSIGDNVSKVPIDMESPTKLDNDKFMKLVEVLEDAKSRTLETKPQNKELVEEKAADLLRLSSDRAVAILAINNLNASPKERELYIQQVRAEEDRKARVERDKKATDFAANAKSSKDVEDYINNLTEENMISPEARQALADKLRELNKAEGEFEAETDYKSLDDLKKQLQEEDDPVRINILKEVVARRESAGETQPLKNRTAPTKNTTQPEDKEDPTPNTTDLEELLKENAVDLTPEEGTDLETLLASDELNRESLKDAKVEEQIKSLLGNRGLELSEDGESYERKDKEGNVIETYKRVSSLKYQIESKFPEQAKRAAARGTIIDDMLRYTITQYNKTGNFPTKEDVKSVYDSSEYKNLTEKFTDKFLNETYNFFVNFLTSQQKLGYMVLTDIPPVFGEINGEKVAGTIDLLAYNPKTGDVKVMDLKTAGRSRKKYYKETIERDGKAVPKYNYEINDAIQLVAYTELIDQMVGIKASTPYILPLIVRKSLDEYNIAASESYISKKTKKPVYILANTKLSIARGLLNLTDKSPKADENLVEETAEEQLRSDVELTAGEQLSAEAQERMEELERLAEEQFEEDDPDAPQETVWTAESKKTKEQRQRPKTGNNLTIANGEIQTVSVDGRVQARVDDNGNFSKGNDYEQQLPDGTPLNINRDIIKNTPEDVLKSTPLEFELIRTRWQVETEKTSNRAVPPNKIPIGIFITIEEKKHLIGMVSAAKFDSPPKFIAERTELAKQLMAGNKVTGGITNIHSGNLINTYNKAGKKVFFPVNEAIEGAEVFFSTKTIRGNMWSISNMEQIPGLDEVKDTLDSMQTNTAVGRIVAIINRPGHKDKKGSLPAYTANMDNKSVQAIMTILSRSNDKRNIAADIKEIVGLPGDPKIDSVFYVSDHEQFADAVVYFRHKNGYIIRMSNEEFAKFRAGEKDYKFSAGSFDFKRTQRPEGYESVVRLSHDQNQFVVGVKGPTQSFSLAWEAGQSFPKAYQSRTDENGNLVPIPNATENNIRQAMSMLPQEILQQLETWTQSDVTERETVARKIYEDAELFDGESIVHDTYGPKVVWENSLNKKYNVLDADPEQVKKKVSIELNKLREDLESSLINSLAAQKRQIDLMGLFTAGDTSAPKYESKVTGKVYDNYLDYLSSAEELESPQEDKKSILTLDSKAHRGSFYYDLKVEFTTFDSTVSRAKDEASTTKKENTEESEVDNTPPAGKGVAVNPGFRSKNKRKKRGEKTGEDIKNECKGN